MCAPGNIAAGTRMLADAVLYVLESIVYASQVNISVFLREIEDYSGLTRTQSVNRTVAIFPVLLGYGVQAVCEGLSGISTKN